MSKNVRLIRIPLFLQLLLAERGNCIAKFSYSHKMCVCRLSSVCRL